MSNQLYVIAVLLLSNPSFIVGVPGTVPNKRQNSAPYRTGDSVAMYIMSPNHGHRPSVAVVGIRMVLYLYSSLMN